MIGGTGLGTCGILRKLDIPHRIAIPIVSIFKYQCLISRLIPVLIWLQGKLAKQKTLVDKSLVY